MVLSSRLVLLSALETYYLGKEGDLPVDFISVDITLSDGAERMETDEDAALSGHAATRVTYFVRGGVIC